MTARPPAPPRYGFTGRASELHKLERWLMRRRLVVIRGFGGVGKTALVREAAEWLTRAGLYVGSCFVSFENGGDAARLLSALGHCLNIYDGKYNPQDTQAAMKKLRPALKKRPTLVIADNLESILPGGEAALDASLRVELWGVLLELAGECGALLTSQDTRFGDGRMADRPETKHLKLDGLHAADAYALASRLLAELEISPSRAPYPELRDLLVQLDHHPLAIQLVLTALKRDAHLTLMSISTEFATLLPKFADDAETGRNRSLLASLKYSLRRLGDEQRKLLARLAPFEGGALEENLLAITEIAERDWLSLRLALEQAALLTPEHVGFTAPFLHFHPVLTPYLRTQPGTPGVDDDALRSRYVARYYTVANHLVWEDTRNPLPVRELARHEMPNLRRALELQLASGDINAALELTDCVASFLRFFGLRRERDELRRRVAQAVSKPPGGPLTQADYLREKGFSDDEFDRGNLRAAEARITALLARIEALPADTPLGQGSLEHCLTLVRLARCLCADGQPGTAEARLREALALIDALIARQSDNQSFIYERNAMLTHLSDALITQHKYTEAQAACEEMLEIAKQLSDPRKQAVVLG